MTDRPQDPLDQAIDRVATKMVTVEPDEAMAARLAARLPERSPARPWFVALLPQLAVAAGVALVAYVVVTNRPADVADTVGTSAPTVEAPASPNPVVPPAGSTEPPPVRNADATVRLSSAATITTPPDSASDFGLAPMPAPTQIAVAAITIGHEIDFDAPHVAPIVLTDLPLASESPSPR